MPPEAAREDLGAYAIADARQAAREDAMASHFADVELATPSAKTALQAPPTPQPAASVPPQPTPKQPAIVAVKPQSKLADAVKFLREALANGSLESHQLDALAKRKGIAKQTLLRAKSKQHGLGLHYRKDGLAGRTMASLPPVIAKAAPTASKAARGVSYYRRNPADVLQITRHLSVLQQHAFDRLELHYMRQGGLTGCADAIALLLGYESPEQIAALASVLSEFYLLGGGRFTRPAFEATLTETRGFIAKQSSAGRKGGSAERVAKARRMQLSGYEPHADIELSDAELKGII